jgi:hypothetical protein
MKKAQIKTMNFVQALICSRRSQIKMMETIAILFIFFILVMFGFIFYSRISKESYSAEAEEITALKAVQISEKANFLTDVQCSMDNIPDEDCIDVYKLQAFSQLAAKEDVYYYNIFEFSVINITEIYPFSGRSWKMYDHPLPDYTDLVRVQLPVSLYYPGEDRYLYGVINVGVYR